MKTLIAASRLGIFLCWFAFVVLLYSRKWSISVCVYWVLSLLTPKLWSFKLWTIYLNLNGLCLVCFDMKAWYNISVVISEFLLEKCCIPNQPWIIYIYILMATGYYNICEILMWYIIYMIPLGPYRISDVWIDADCFEVLSRQGCSLSNWVT